MAIPRSLFRDYRKHAANSPASRQGRHNMVRMNRRQFLLSLGAAVTATAGGAYAWRRTHSSKTPPLPAGEILGASDALGHRLQAMNFPEPTETLKVPVVVVGGVSPACPPSGNCSKVALLISPFWNWNQVGGNARRGAERHYRLSVGRALSPFPHPGIPRRARTAGRFRRAARRSRRRGAELRRALHNFAPQERLYANGIWHDGLWPQVGVRQRDHDQYRRFRI